MPKKRIAKGSKKGWKQYDMGAVQSALAEINQQELVQSGVKNLADKDLFVVEKKQKSSEKKKEKREKINSNIPKRVETDFIKPIKPTKPPQKLKKDPVIGNPEKIEKKPKAMKIARTGVYDLWETEDLKPTTKVVKQSHVKKMTQLPHGGQSYNPDATEHQNVLKAIHKKEAKIERQSQKLMLMLKYKETPQRTEEEITRQSEESEEEDELDENGKKIKKKRVKKTLVKRTNIKKAKKELSVYKDRKRKREEPSMEEIEKEISTLSKNTVKYLKNRKNRLARKPEIPVRSVNDVLLSNEVSSGLRNLEANSYGLWLDNLKTLKNSDIFEDVHLNKIKNTTAYPGFPVKDYD
jgi:nucleolar protein 53